MVNRGLVGASETLTRRYKSPSRIGNTNGLLAPPPRLHTLWSTRASPASCHALPTSSPARSVLRGLDMRRRMSCGRAIRGDVWGRPQKRWVGECWGGRPGLPLLPLKGIHDVNPAYSHPRMYRTDGGPRKRGMLPHLLPPSASFARR
jgi:hypothetical protein